MAECNVFQMIWFFCNTNTKIRRFCSPALKYPYWRRKSWPSTKDKNSLRGVSWLEFSEYHGRCCCSIRFGTLVLELGHLSHGKNWIRSGEVTHIGTIAPAQQSNKMGFINIWWENELQCNRHVYFLQFYAIRSISGRLQINKEILII